MTFEIKPTEVPGVQLVTPAEDAPYARENFLRCESPMIRVRGRFAVADAVIRQIVRNWRSPGAPYAGLRFGRGGRRQYRFVTEDLLECLMGAAALEPFRPSEAQVARHANIQHYVLDLLALLPGEGN